MADENLFIGCDKTVTMTGLLDADTGSYLNAATLAWVLTNAAGTIVATGTLAYVAASNGNYKGVIDGATVTSTLTEGAIYTFTLTGIQTTFDDQRTVPLIAKRRRLT